MPATDLDATPGLDAELTAERAHLGASRAALKRMRERAEALFATGDKVAGDSYTAEQLGRHMARRVKELADDPTTPLFFGRLDFGGDDPDHAGREYHVGRRHVTDELGEPLVLDWRAPVSRSFYRASARDPQGVAVRRRFGFSAGTLTSFEDEHLDRGEELGTASRILTAEIERPRVGPMRDIVATIQPEQDELVRADLADSICVQGAPGTGKTAVGLHRAAYLLYLHRERLRRSGVLIVGPNRAFLSYIAAVLPALGEVEVEQATVEDLVARVPVRAVDDPAAAALKHDVRMAEVLRRAVDAHIGTPTEPIMVSDGSYRWRIGLDPLHRLVTETRQEGLPYATGRERVRARVVGLLQRQAEARRAESPNDAWLRRMSRIKPVTDLLDTVWPALTPDGLLHRLRTDADALAAAADGLLTPEEQELFRSGKVARTAKATRWTAADAVLIDEVAGLLERPAGFGHVVVDEAQDLSPMQCRAIARRSEHGSITLLGDLAQGTAPWAATDWRESLAHLGKPDAAVVPLSVGFRVPAAVVAFANRLLPALAVDVPPARSLRNDGALDVRTAEDLTAATVAEVRAALAHDGSVGVIAADDAVDRLRAALADAGVETATADDVEAATRVTVVPATLVKGLEYDHVVVVEPAAIVAAEPRGLHRLYVVLTRAVSRLAVLHREPLPGPLTA
ncbi:MULTISPECIES: AAA family ATPase [unclassified Micromonospora]|uniref:HelD family protein n=1 Tax=unclassified Micromonospora TaxID=2617518 RepID=UPI0022B712BB|nr:MULTISPECIES: AAA family ATPase [unclassified Micromonospora]MCZ7478715.1 AAA family ATPase [Micromonospora sp. WMMC273]WBC03396.1 AAA family ATPase [Micromonospora sp. WMMA1976]WBC03422.1 AAA family ATPase [Micromonospora sp. WMMA1976]